MMTRNCYENIATLVKTKRRMANVTQKQLSQKLNIHIQQVCNIESGKCSVPRYLIREFCEALNIKKQEMFQALSNDAMSSLITSFRKDWLKKSS